MIRNIRYDEVFGENKKRIFNIIGLKASNTDYATNHTLTHDEYTLSDSVVSTDIDKDYFDSSLVLRKQKATTINHNGEIDYRGLNNPLVGIRLSGNYSDIKDQATVVEDLGNGIKIVEYGEYPTTYVNKFRGQPYYKVDKDKAFKETGKTYWVPALEVQLYLSPLLEPHVKYTSVERIPEEYIEIKEYVDSNGNKYVEYKEMLFLVTPIRWYVDEKEDYIVSVNTITGGIPYGSYFRMLYPELEDTYSIDHFVKNKVVNDLIPSVIYELPEEYIPEIEEPATEPIKLPNLDNLNREQLVALQEKISSILKENQTKPYVPTLK